MTLEHPFVISARLLPALKIGDSFLSFDEGTNVFYFDTPDFQRGSCGLTCRAGHIPVKNQFKGMLSFLMASAEAQNAADRGGKSDNYDIFDPVLSRWCQENQSEISSVLFELEENHQ